MPNPTSSSASTASATVSLDISPCPSVGPRRNKLKNAAVDSLSVANFFSGVASKSSGSFRFCGVTSVVCGAAGKAEKNSADD